MKYETAIKIYIKNHFIVRAVSQYSLSQHIIFIQYNNIVYTKLEMSLLGYGECLCLELQINIEERKLWSSFKLE